VNSAVSVLTTVGVDHAAYLGNTPAANAAEKVDIVKPGSIAISASQPPEVLELLAARADKVGATVALLGRDFHLDSNETAVGGRSVSLRTARAAYQELFVPLHGAHQGVNLALAVAAAEAFLGRQLDFDLLQDALASVTSPGRLEVMGRQPLVVLDGAHNPNAAVALKTTLASDFLFKSLTMVLSIFDDKDIPAMLELLVPSADRVIFTRADNPRAAKPEVLRGAAPVVPGQDPPDLVEPLERAVDRALQISDDDDMVLVTGSLHGVGQARKHLLGSTE
jgi:dihydrofolate synthase/folylpolyglutamate synthase